MIAYILELSNAGLSMVSAGSTINLFGNFRCIVIQKIGELWGSEVTDSLLHKLIVAPPTEDRHGDVYTNAALVVGKFKRKNPMEIAEHLRQALAEVEGVDSVDVVPPGFVNLKCSNEVWYSAIRDINKAGKDYGAVNLGQGQKVNVEFVSANPTGPLHIGHARGAVFGDVLSNLLAWVGYDVTREYYVNDAGGQINTLVESVYLRYKEALGEQVTIGEGLYPGEYLKPIAKALVEKHGDKLLASEDRTAVIREFALKSILDLIREDMALLGVKHDVFTYEADLQRSRTVEKCVEFLQQKGMLYYGTLERPRGVEEEAAWQAREQLLFRSTDFGDDSDRALQKEDGSWTYFAGDIAYHFDKISRGFHDMILGLGFDHKGYVSRLKAAVHALSDGKATIDVKLHNMVNFLENGVPVKMSKRRGEFLTARDVVEEVGKDVARFIMMTRKNDVVLDFDFAKAKEQSKDSQIFYIQYAHARACSLMRNAPTLLPIEDVDFSRVSSAPEIALIKLLVRWPNIVESSAVNHEPHRIAFYLLEVAEAFHVLWGHGSRSVDMRFIVEGDIATTSARIYLVKVVALVISLGLSIFSIAPMEEMR
ncbi:arginyl-tRNA synthetase [Anaplasma centrale str. Israel]|uniref:Arginine--tRNA ligase n=2 Tax=Anaplasma centrale TaxID=769 RepID=D1AUJ1_ANACI|nr:arginyl-tRNA synthetase [Anaplasma centrale str. Israel]